METPDGKTAPVVPEQPVGRWTLLRDLVVFQGKLIVDGFRDFILVPVSLIAALGDLVLGSKKGSRFYSVVVLGKRSESWINLFGAAKRVDAAPDALEVEPDDSIDAVVERIENRIREQYKQGGLTATAKEAIDRTLDAIQRDER